jgi:CRP-like cAMP-binding protein
MIKEKDSHSDSDSDESIKDLIRRRKKGAVSILLLDLNEE